MRLVLLILLTWACQAQVHVNACTPQDAGFTGGLCYTSPIALPAGAPSYLGQERYGNFGYRFPLTDGQYTVTLHFIENSTAITGVGQRQFSASINGTSVLTAFDLAAAAPLNTPVDRTFSVSATGGVGVTIVFTTVVRNAVVSAIDIVPVPVNPFPGCSSDGAGGIACTGNVAAGSGSPSLGTLMLGSFGIAWSGVPSTPPVVMLSPVGDGTGKYLSDGGAVACPATLPLSVAALTPACHQFVWASATFAAALPGDKVIAQLAATPCNNPAGCAGIRTVQAADGSMYYLVDASGNK